MAKQRIHVAQGKVVGASGWNEAVKEFGEGVEHGSERGVDKAYDRAATVVKLLLLGEHVASW